jgi:hypothetical protein
MSRARLSNSVLAPASSVDVKALTVKSLTPANRAVPLPVSSLTRTTAWPGRSLLGSSGSFSSGITLRYETVVQPSALNRRAP